MEKIKPWSWETEFGTATVVHKKKHIKAVEQLLGSGMFLLDTETTGLGPDRKLRLVQVGWGKQSWLIDPNNDFGLVETVVGTPSVMVAHNAPFDLLSLGNHVFEFREEAYDWAIQTVLNGQVHDTMTTEQMVHSESRVKSLSKLAGLEGVHNFYEDEFNDEAARQGITEEDKYEYISCNDPYWLRYSAHDIWQLKAAWKRNRGNHQNFAVQMEVQVRVLYEILRDRGMMIDYDAAETLHTELRDKLLVLEKRLMGAGINKIYSAAQVATALEDLGADLSERTPTGRPKMDKEVLYKLSEAKSKPVRAAAQDLVKARSLSSDISRIDNLIVNSTKVNSKYGTVHPKLWSIGAATGRSSCSEPNLQQLNKHTGEARVRGLLRADPGRITGSVDFETIEIRVLADLSGDNKLIDHLMSGADVHGELADEVGIDRQAAKVGNFAMLYGAGASSIAKQTGMDEEQAIGLRESWRELYPDASAAMEAWVQEAEETGCTVLRNGWKPKTGDSAYRAVNYQIQGWAAVVFKKAAIQLATAGLWEYVVMVVHDEFALNLPKKKAVDLLEEVAKKAVVQTENITYTTSGELYGKHWGIK